MCVNLCWAGVGGYQEAGRGHRAHRTRHLAPAGAHRAGNPAHILAAHAP